MKTPEQKILELDAKIKLFEKQKAKAEHLAERTNKKVINCKPIHINDLLNSSKAKNTNKIFNCETIT